MNYMINYIQSIQQYEPALCTWLCICTTALIQLLPRVARDSVCLLCKKDKWNKHCKHGPGVAATVVDIKNPRGNISPRILIKDEASFSERNDLQLRKDRARQSFQANI